MRTWIPLIIGTFLVSYALLTPDLDRSARAVSGFMGAALIVTGLAPGRTQYQDPTHRVYRHHR